MEKSRQRASAPLLPKGSSQGGSSASGAEASADYCYIKADPDHYDLEDLFGGKYIKARGVWRFNKDQEQAVYKYLDCDSSESDQEGVDQLYGSSPDMDDSSIPQAVKDAVKEKRRQRDRLHRANSFNASDNTDDDCDSVDNEYRRHRISKTRSTKERNLIKKEVERH